MVVLASASKYRKALLARLGVEFKSVEHTVDERAVKGQPAEVAKALARAKAQSVLELCPNDLVIGSDQLAELDGKALGKPGTEEPACRQLRALAARTHQLHTAVCVMDSHRVREELVTVEMTMRELTDAEIQRYVAAESPVDCAGSYKIESMGIALFESIRASDMTAIEGLPLMILARMLRAFGLEIPGHVLMSSRECPS